MAALVVKGSCSLPSILGTQLYSSSCMQGTSGIQDDDLYHTSMGQGDISHLRTTSRSDKYKFAELDNIGLPEDVRNKARERLAAMYKSTKRGHKRKLMLVRVVLDSFNELNIHHDPNRLAEKLGVSKGDVKKSSSMYSEVQTGIKSHIVKEDPLNLLPDYCQEAGVPDGNIPVLIEMGRMVLDKDQKLYEESPQKVAGGILVCYLDFSGYTYDMNRIKEIVGLSAVTINTIAKYIKKLYNS